jgi:hypothetical protein
MKETKYGMLALAMVRAMGDGRLDELLPPYDIRQCP